MPLILGSQSAVSTGFSIDNSCRFNLADDASMEWTQAIEGNRDAWTFSCWLKRGEVPTSDGGDQIFSSSYQGNVNNSLMSVAADGHLQWDERNNDDSTLVGEKSTTQLLRDPGAWYHIVYIWDSANGTTTDRMQIWVNGVRVTTFASSTDPGSDQNAGRGKAGGTVTISRWGSAGGSEQFDGYMAEVVFLDGAVASPVDTLGQFNEDSPSIWEPIDPSGLTFGDEGYYLDFGDSAALGDDVSGNSNDFTPANLAAADQATDSPTNNFSTFNPLNIPITAAPTFSEGNCEVVSQVGAGLNFGGTSTICVSAGKWYWECSPVSVSNSSVIGVTGRPATDAYLNDPPGHDSDSYGYVNNGEKLTSNSGSSYGTTYTDGDIIGVALDITNLKIYFAKNGTWQDSGDPTSGATGTGAAFTITAPALTTEGIYAFSAADYANGATTFQANFGGCPAFTVSSAAADGNGYGAFEYAPPSGYLALCTKNLGSDGG